MARAAAGVICGLRNALTLHELLPPGTHLAGIPRWLQDAALGGLASLARRSGLSAYVQPQISIGALQQD